MESNTNQIIISIEGNIAAGKSTFLRVLNANRKELGEEFEILKEPVTEWQNVEGSGINLLDLLYQDINRYAYIFESYSLYTKTKRWNDMVSQAPLVLTERSIQTDK